MFFLSVILGSAQTYVGVLVTLIALSIFISPENNYIRRIVSNFNTDMRRILEESYRIIKKDTTEKGNSANKRTQSEIFWLRDMDDGKEKQELMQNIQAANDEQQKFYIYGQTEINNYEQVIQQLSKRKEDTFASLHLLIVSLFVMFLDVFDIEPLSGAIFIYLLIIPSSLFSLKLLDNYYNQPELKEAQGLQEANVWKKLVVHEIVSMLILLCLLTGLLVFHWCFYLPVFLLLLFFITPKMLGYHWNNLTIDRYNYRFAAKHSFYMTLFAIIGTIVIICLLHFSWLRDLFINFNWDVETYLNRWCDNITTICQIEYARYVFVFYLTLFAFFLPILKGYWYNRSVARECMKHIGDEKGKHEEKIQGLNKRYEEIIMEYQARKNKEK